MKRELRQRCVVVVKICIVTKSIINKINLVFLNFKINLNQKNYNLTFNESLNIENSSDSHEQRKYENIIKNNVDNN